MTPHVGRIVVIGAIAFAVIVASQHGLVSRRASGTHTQDESGEAHTGGDGERHNNAPARSTDAEHEEATEPIGRPLRVVVETPSLDLTGATQAARAVLQSRFSAALNPRIASPRAYAADGMLVLEFDFKPYTRRDGLDGPEPLLIRLYDAHGSFLTSFETREIFSSWNYRTVDQASGKNWPSGHMQGWEELKPTGNRLAYQVAERDLAFAGIVAIGFVYRQYPSNPFTNYQGY